MNVRRFAPLAALATWVVLLFAVSTPAARATDYLTAEEARRLAFPDADRFEEVEVTLTKTQRKAVEKNAGVRMRFDSQPIWRVVRSGDTAGWFVVDEVLGKHEFITYAVALDATGSVRSVEILSYRETHGGEVQNPKWLDQFDTRVYDDEDLRLGKGVQNIAGATLSCKHLTEGVRRVLALHHEILAPLGTESPG